MGRWSRVALVVLLGLAVAACSGTASPPGSQTPEAGSPSIGVEASPSPSIGVEASPSPSSAAAIHLEIILPKDGVHYSEWDSVLLMGRGASPGSWVACFALGKDIYGNEADDRGVWMGNFTPHLEGLIGELDVTCISEADDESVTNHIVVDPFNWRSPTP